jgi:hypothetical protein
MVRLLPTVCSRRCWWRLETPGLRDRCPSWAINASMVASRMSIRRSSGTMPLVALVGAEPLAHTPRFRSECRPPGVRGSSLSSPCGWTPAIVPIRMRFAAGGPHARALSAREGACLCRLCSGRPRHRHTCWATLAFSQEDSRGADLVGPLREWGTLLGWAEGLLPGRLPYAAVLGVGERASASPPCAAASSSGRRGSVPHTTRWPQRRAAWVRPPRRRSSAGKLRYRRAPPQTQ